MRFLRRNSRLPFHSNNTILSVNSAASIQKTQSSRLPRTQKQLSNPQHHNQQNLHTNKNFNVRSQNLNFQNNNNIKNIRDGINIGRSYTAVDPVRVRNINLTRTTRQINSHQATPKRLDSRILMNGQNQSRKNVPNVPNVTQKTKMNVFQSASVDQLQKNSVLGSNALKHSQSSTGNR